MIGNLMKASGDYLLMNRRLFLKALLTSLTSLAQACSFRSPKSLNNSQTNNLATKQNLQLQLSQNLTDVIDAWFPLTLDIKYGGFLCDFDDNWQPNGPHQKRLEFQARQVRAVAQAAIFDDRYRQAYDAAEHGFRFLTEIMWDNKYGGWFYMLHRNGKPVFTEKHLHGVAYGIQACIAHHYLTGRMEGLDVAKSAFNWLDSHAYDSVNGGYHSYLKRNGTPITTPSLGGDLVGDGRIGLKDFNTTMDLTEAFSDLYRATTDSHVGRRLNELLVIVKNSMIRPPGVLYSYYTPDWKPASNRIKIGLSLQASCILIKASSLMPVKLRSDITDIARSIVDTCLRDAWDKNAGGFYKTGIVIAGSIAVQDRRKVWWVQAEGMRALLKQAFGESGEAKEYFDQWLRLWTYIDLKLIDHTRKGWYKFDSGSSRNIKANQWKDASHEVRALIECIQMLKGAH